MKMIPTKRLILLIALATTVAAATPAAAQTTWFSTTLAGDRVTGDPGDSDGWGVAAVGIDGATTRYYIWVTDIAMPTAAHIHAGVAGADTLTFAPLANRIRGIFDLVPSVPSTDRRQDDMLITFSSSRPILMYLSAVDNVTSDAIFVMAEPAPAIAAMTANSPPNGTIVQPSSNVTIQEGEAVDYQGSATDPDGDEMTYHWDFGDGMPSTSLSPGEHTYDESGTYTVVFTVTDSRGAVDPTPDTRTITVEGGGGELATFTAVQSRIFTTSCAFSGCHGGSSPAQGMNLSAGMAFSNIVDVASSEQPSLDRIEPNDPASSYLYLKVIDDPSISGSRMPRGAPALSQELIDLLRDWIERGAPND